MEKAVKLAEKFANIIDLEEKKSQYDYVQCPDTVKNPGEFYGFIAGYGQASLEFNEKKFNALKEKIIELTGRLEEKDSLIDNLEHQVTFLTWSE